MAMADQMQVQTLKTLNSISLYLRDIRDELSKMNSNEKEELINKINKIFMDRFDCDGIRVDWTNADIRETIHFELEQLKEG